MLKTDYKGLKFAVRTLRRQLIHLNLQLLYQCNYKCRICDFWKEEYSDYPRLTVGQARIIEEKLRRTAPLIISLGGGEPLMHPDIIPIIKILSKRHFPVMISNGWFITETLARQIFRAGLHEVSISIDYADPVRHDSQRGREGAYAKAVEALKILRDSRAAANQRVHLISVVMDDNIAEIESLILLAREIGVTYLVTLYSDGRGKKASGSSQLDISGHLLKLKQKYNEFVVLPGYIGRFNESLRLDEGISPCFAGRNLFNIGPRGEVSLCIDRLDKPAGNIFTDNMEVIQNNLLELHRSNTCGSCWTSCRGAIETLLYGGNKLSNTGALYQTIKNVPLERQAHHG